MAIQELEVAVTTNSDATACHESEIKRLSTQLSKLPEKTWKADLRDKT